MFVLSDTISLLSYTKACVDISKHHIHTLQDTLSYRMKLAHSDRVSIQANLCPDTDPDPTVKIAAQKQK